MGKHRGMYNGKVKFVTRGEKRESDRHSKEDMMATKGPEPHEGNESNHLFVPQVWLATSRKDAVVTVK